MEQSSKQTFRLVEGLIRGGGSFEGLGLEVFAIIGGKSKRIGSVEVDENGRYQLKVDKKYRAYKGDLSIRLIDANGEAFNYKDSQGFSVDLLSDLSQAARVSRRVQANFTVPQAVLVAPAPAAKLVVDSAPAQAPASALAPGGGTVAVRSGPTTTAAVASVLDDAGVITGRVPSLGVTDDTSLRVVGGLGGLLEGAALGVGESVHIYDGATDLGVATVTVVPGGQSQWVFDDPRVLLHGQIVSYTARVMGANGELSEPGRAYSVSIDAAAPTVQILTDTPSLGLGETTLVGFELSEPSTSFTAASVTVAGGTLSNFTGSGSSYKATFTADGTGLASIAVGSGAFRDLSGIFNTASADRSFGAPAPELVILIDGEVAFRDANKNGLLDNGEDSVTLADPTSFTNWLTSIGASFSAQASEVRFTGVPAFSVDLTGFDVDDRIVVDMSRKPWAGVNVLSEPQVLRVMPHTPLGLAAITVTATVTAARPTGWNRFSSATASGKSVGLELWQRPATSLATAPGHANRLFIGKVGHNTTNGDLVFSAGLAASTRRVVRNGVTGRGSSGVMAVLGANPSISYILPTFV
jgi:hypothetical protein